MVRSLALIALGAIGVVVAYHEPEKEIISTPQYPFGTSFPMTSTQPVPHYTWDGEIWAGTSLSFNPGATFSYTNSFYVPELVDTWHHDEVDDDYHAVVPTPAPITMPPTPHPGEGVKCNKLYGPLCVPGLYCQVNPGYNPHQFGVCQHSDEHGIGTEGWLPGNTGGSASWISVGNSHTPTVSTDKGSCANACGMQSFTGDCWCDDKCLDSGDCCPDIQIQCSNEYTATMPSSSSDSTLNSMNNLNSWMDAFTPYTSTNIFDSSYSNPSTMPAPTATTYPAPPTSTIFSSTPTTSTMPSSTMVGPSTQDISMPNAYSASGSCVNNCGKEIKTASGKCWCDATCEKYGDCCADLKTYCA